MGNVRFKKVDHRIKQKLGEQLRFISRSSEAFDKGAEEEAIRIAVSLRVIFHDTRNCVSILKHLELKDQKVLSSASGHGNWQDYLGHKLDLKSPTPMTMVPLLKAKFSEVSLGDWWENESVFRHNGEKFSRRKIILSVAEKDGGAHVDRRLEAYYEILCAGEYALRIIGNLEYPGKPPFPQGVTQYATNAHLALIRQFAHETLASAKYFKWPAI